MNKNKYPGAYNICLTQPPGYKHSLAFEEVALLLRCSFQELGLSCTLSLNRLEKNKINLLLGANLLSEPPQNEYTYVVYQLEQLDKEEGWFSPLYEKILRQAHKVWDYSCENIAFLSNHSITALHLPLGYAPQLEQINRTKEEDIDILFYGSLNKRRENILQPLQKSFATEILFGVYGQKRDRMIGRSKIVLNVHYYEKQIVETVRLSYLLNNRKFFISEDSLRNPYKSLGIFVPYDSLIDACSLYVGREKERSRIAYEGYERFRENKMVENLNQLLLS